MTILLVNDDGYEAVGIKALESVLSRYGHEIWVSAPKTQMSGMSHAMTIGRPMKISRFGENHYFMDGTPVDCILYAKRYEEGLFPHDPDLVISGTKCSQQDPQPEGQRIPYSAIKRVKSGWHLSR